jgi:hypothetical protein
VAARGFRSCPSPCFVGLDRSWEIQISPVILQEILGRPDLEQQGDVGRLGTDTLEYEVEADFWFIAPDNLDIGDFLEVDDVPIAERRGVTSIDGEFLEFGQLGGV